MRRNFEEREKAYKLALEGKTDQQIADILYTNRRSINEWINDLNNPRLDDYNIELYNQILFRRNALHDIVDKDTLNEIIELLYHDFTLIEIACLFNQTESDIKKQLQVYNMKSSSFYDPEFYTKLILKNSENTEKNEQKLFERFNKLTKEGVNLKDISKAKIVKKFYRRLNARRIINSLIDSNYQASDAFLAKKCGVNEEFVTKLLQGNDQEKLGYVLFSKEIMEHIKEIRLQRHEKNRQHLKINVTNNNGLSHDDKVKISEINREMSFWFRIIFSFRLTLKEFGEIVQFSNLEALSKMLYQSAANLNNYYVNALNYLFSSSSIGKDNERIKKVQEYLAKLQKTRENNPMEYKKLLEQINDQEYKNLVKKHSVNKAESLSDEDIRVVLEYRLKYALPTRALPFKNDLLHRRCPEDLKEQIAELDYLNIQQSRAQYVYNSTRLKK